MYRGLLENIREHFAHSKKSIHKARNEIRIIDFHNSKLVVKSFKIPSIFNKIVYTFLRDSKAKKSYNNSIRISEFVPKAIGYKIYKKFGLINQSYFISENFEYDFTIREPLLDKNFKDRDAIFREFAKFTYNLHQNNIFHLDYSPGNILIKKSSNGYIFKIVDINRMKFKTLSQDERLKNFSKLWAKDEDMEIIIDEYAKLIDIDIKSAILKAVEYSQKNKDIKNFKKRLKGEKVVD